MADLNIVLLEERTPSGWAGAAAITCPHCGLEHIVNMATVGNSRSVSFWDAPDHQVVDRQSVKP